MKFRSLLTVGIVLFVFLGVIASIGLSWYFWSLQPASASQEKQTFIVKKGQAVSQIARDLEEAGLIRSATAFVAYTKLQNSGTAIQAGSFSLSPNLSVPEVIKEFSKGTEDIWITIPEGWRAEQVAASAASQLDTFDSELFMDLVSQNGSEGKLFPDTYLVPREMSEEQLYRLLLSTFERKTQGLDLSASSFTLDEVLVLASLIQREARTYDQMRHVSGILVNRLDIGMPLQVDATLQYVKGNNSPTGEWWSQPLAADKQLLSAYNTYQNSGLPPGPICNPGLDALKAALDPLPTDDLFYLHAPDGTMYYAQNLQDHNRNVDTYLR